MAGQSIKHLEISKAKSNTLAVVGVATIVVVFCLMSTKALLGQAAYQRKVINARHEGLAKLQSNVDASKQLVTQYSQVFEGSNPSNVIGGQNTTNASALPPSGDNARIVLDALPSKYDYPALLSSVNYILTKNGAHSVVITGTDATATAANDPTANPSVIPIQLTIGGLATYDQVQAIVHDFERSIRPFDITNLQQSVSDSNVAFTMSITSYYQQAQSLKLTTKGIK